MLNLRIVGMRMKRSLLGSASVGALILATSAQAADLGRPVYKAPAVAPAPWSWTGFYVGGNVGAVSDHSSISNDPASSNPWLTAPPTANATGVIGGLEAGYNWQMSQLVLGLEGDVSWSSANQSVVTPTPATGKTDTYTSRLNALATIRGRVGWAFDRALLYGTGGVAFANFKDQLVDSVFPFTAAPSSSTTGWTAGGGIEYALTDHWTAKAEYLHVGFSSRTATDNFGLGYVFDFKDRLDIGRVGINYKF
jgi:outer membrane immunogenic protein